jgi:hypothetical protein
MLGTTKSLPLYTPNKLFSAHMALDFGVCQFTPFLSTLVHFKCSLNVSAIEPMCATKRIAETFRPMRKHQETAFLLVQIVRD